MTQKKTLYALPEYIVLPAKLRKYALFTIVDGRSHSSACTLLRLNPDRVKNDVRIQRIREALAGNTATDYIQIPSRMLEGMTAQQILAFYEAVDRLNDLRVTRDVFPGVLIVDEDGNRYESKAVRHAAE